MSNPFKPSGETSSADQLAFRGPLPAPRGGIRGPMEGVQVPPVRLPVPPPRPTQVPPPQPAPRPMPQPLPQPQVQPQTQTQQQTDAPPATREQTREGEENCKSDKKDCVKCPPDQGVMAIANSGKGHSMSDLSSRYQQWVTNFPYPHEWMWKGTWWDGFDKSRCALLEAKANYAFMFIPIFNTPRPWAPVEEELLRPAKKHSQKASPTPPVWVEWHFLQKIVYEYCSGQYMDFGLANLKAYWNPMPGTNDYQEYEELRREEEMRWNEYLKNNPEMMA